jgi:hypothetical protein
VALNTAAYYGAALVAASGGDPKSLPYWTSIASVFLAMLQNDAVIDPGLVPGVGLTYLNTGTPTIVTGTGKIT